MKEVSFFPQAQTMMRAEVKSGQSGRGAIVTHDAIKCVIPFKAQPPGRFTCIYF